MVLDLSHFWSIFLPFIVRSTLIILGAWKGPGGPSTLFWPRELYLVWSRVLKAYRRWFGPYCVMKIYITNSGVTPAT